jgi:hypothetical protein
MKPRLDLQVAFGAMHDALRSLQRAFGEYLVEHGESPPFPFSKDDPKMSKIVEAKRAQRRAEDARDAAFARIDQAKEALSGPVE